MRKLCLFRDVWDVKVPKTNEEYKEYLKKKDQSMRWIVVVGILLVILGSIGEFMDVPIDDYMLGIYLGVGTGLIVAAIGLSIKHKRLMKNEEKLKRARLEMGDERIQEISKKAFRMAAWIMIIAMYAIMLVGGLFYPILAKTLVILICLFLVVYSLCYSIFEKRM